MKSFYWFLPSMGIFIGILLLSTILAIPIQLPKGANNIDKIEHGFAYFVLTSSIFIGFYKSGLYKTVFWMIIVLGAISYGLILEWVQYTFFPNRYFEWMDALANTIGVILAGGLFRLIKHV